MWQVKYKESDAQWEKISEEQLISRLEGYYKRVDWVMTEMKSHPGSEVPTNFAYYRWIEKEQSK